MAIDYQLLKTLPEEQALAYLRSQLGGGVGPITPEIIQGEGGGGYSTFVPSDIGLLQRGMGADPEGYSVTFDSPYGPDRDYLAQFGPDGALRDVMLQPKSSWTEQTVAGIPVGLFLPLAAAAAATAIPALTGSAAGSAGISPGVMAGLETAVPGAGAGLAPGATAAGTAATEVGLAGLGELGINTALTNTQLLANNAYAAALANGATAEVAANAAQIATNLAGSGLTEAAIIDSAVAAAGDTMATGAVGAAGNVIGGGGALTVTGGVAGSVPTGLDALWQGVKDVAAKAGIKDLKTAIQAGLVAAPLLEKAFGSKPGGSGDGGYTNLVTPYTLDRQVNPQAQTMTSQDAYAYLRGQPSPTTNQPVSTAQQKWFTDTYTPQESFNPVSGERFVRDPNTNRMISSEEIEKLQNTVNKASGGIAALAAGGGIGHLGGYSDGGRLLKGPGDGVSDSIPATIGGRQPARLADGEFVVPARIVSELGNGSTDAGARKLYAMMDRIQEARRKTVGKGRVAKDSKADKHLPA